MRSLLTFAACAATFLPLVIAAPDPNTVQWNFKKRTVQATPGQLARRQTSKTVNSVLTNDLVLYMINVTVGTPAQTLGLQIDTGSSDIWFPASSASYCRRYGCPYGSYDAASSSSYRNPGYGQFEIQYVDGTMVQGQYISDTLSVGGTSVTNLTMAAATQTGQEGYGIMGIGFSADESSNTGSTGFTYPNIIDVLVAQGKINTKSYSLWLDDLASDTGSILFGGVDKSKYTGSLISIPIQKSADSGQYTSFTVAWTGLTVTGGGQTYNANPSSPQPAILDSGTTELYLPNDITNNIYNGVGVITDSTYGNVVPCNVGNNSLTFTFQFGGSSGPRVAIPVSEFVFPAYTTSGRIPTFKNGPSKGKQVCYFGIQPAGDNPILFGDTFLRSAYVVYDLDNLQIGMAQTNRDGNSNANSVVAFSSGTIMPDATATVTSVVVSASTNDNGPNVQSSATGTGDAGDSATTRTATYSLTTATGSGGSSSAASPATVPSIQRSTIAVLGVTLVAFLCGTML